MFLSNIVRVHGLQNDVARIVLLGSLSIFSGCSTSPISPSVVLQTPLPLSTGQPGSLQGLRPAFVVQNSRTIGPVNSLVYVFEIATNLAFSPTVMTGTVLEGQRETRFVVARDLEFGTTYYWRARATDTTIGLSSPFSDIRTFVTIGPPQNGRVSLQLDLAQSCGTFFGQREFTIDGEFSVFADTKRFSAPSVDGVAGHELLLVINQAGSAVQGSIRGFSRDRFGYVLSISKAFDDVSAADLTDTAITGRRLEGTFDGYVSVSHPTFGLGLPCTAMGHKWALAIPDS